ncbi:hypothetical protein Bbelb_263870 [Branchiostoma belcheri]|nr:hypothetical protein Bbelb_263870 [Branchiostoma belcheri]
MADMGSVRGARTTPHTKLQCIQRIQTDLELHEVDAQRWKNYVVSVGIVDKLSQYFKSVRGPIDQDLKAAEFLGSGMGLLASMNKFVSSLGKSNSEKGPKKDDTTQLIHTYKVTELVGIVSLLYGMLLHSGAPERGPSPPPEAFPPHTLHVATMGIRMLNNMAGLDLNMLQTALGEEGISLEFRHIASYLLWYCTHWTNQDLLHEVILIVGYFTALNSDNQVIVQSGRTPTVLQQLCALPFQYFSDPQLVAILFPTLISCCYQNEQNRKILQQEISSSLLATFIEGRIQDSQQQILLPSKRPKTSGSHVCLRTVDKPSMSPAADRLEGMAFPSHTYICFHTKQTDYSRPGDSFGVVVRTVGTMMVNRTGDEGNSPRAQHKASSLFVQTLSIPLMNLPGKGEGILGMCSPTPVFIVYGCVAPVLLLETLQSMSGEGCPPHKGRGSAPPDLPVLGGLGPVAATSPRRGEVVGRD